MPTLPIFEFGPFRLDPNQRLLFKDGREIPLDPQAFEVLRVLVQAQGRLFPKMIC
jgi:DNA-binding response OmpR family regulator